MAIVMKVDLVGKEFSLYFARTRVQLQLTACRPL